LSLAKAAQFNLAQSLAQVYNPQGIHVGVVVVGGVVQDSNPRLNAKNIAMQTWGFYDQPKDLQTFAVEILE
jgi:NAD(P)-dependent dehydrogenase (short-subunit alcohol dehydrogenase family)